MVPERERLPNLDQLNYEILEWIPTQSNGMARLVKAKSHNGDLVTIKIARVDNEETITEKHNLAICSEADCLQDLLRCSGVVPVLPIEDTVGNGFHRLSHHRDTSSENSTRRNSIWQHNTRRNGTGRNRVSRNNFPQNNILGNGKSRNPATHNGASPSAAAQDGIRYCQRLADEGAPAYLIQPFLAGATLSRYIGTEPADLIITLNFIYSLARTLQWIHDTGWVHRDLKPSNIMFAEPPSQQVKSRQFNPILIDFGIAVPINQQAVAEGTLGWMAPEVRLAFEQSSVLVATPACDIYGLGLLLCYMLSGQRPTTNRSSQESRQELIDNAIAAVQESISIHSKGYNELLGLIYILLHKDPEMRPTAYTVGNQVAQILTTLHRPISFSQRFAMHRRRYATPFGRLMASVAVALITIFLGQQLLQNPEQSIQSIEAVSVVEMTATAAITSPAGFPSAHQSPTATLLPPTENELLSKATRTSVIGDASSVSSQAGIEATSTRILAINPATAESGLPNHDNQSTALRPSDSWFSRLAIPNSILEHFSWIATPIADNRTNVSNGANVLETSRPAFIPTVTSISTPVSTSAATSIQAVTPGPFIFPITAHIVEVIGNQHICNQDWRATDTWNSHAPDARITIRWKRVGRIPFDALARFQIGVAVDEENLIPRRATPISEIVTANEVQVDALDALWAINGLVERNQVVRRPYVWGVFLTGASGGMVTRVSPACYFQLDGDLERILPSE